MQPALTSKAWRKKLHCQTRSTFLSFLFLLANEFTLYSSHFLSFCFVFIWLDPQTGTDLLSSFSFFITYGTKKLLRAKHGFLQTDLDTRPHISIRNTQRSLHLADQLKYLNQTKEDDSLQAITNRTWNHSHGWREGGFKVWTTIPQRKDPRRNRAAQNDCLWGKMASSWGVRIVDMGRDLVS